VDPGRRWSCRRYSSDRRRAGGCTHALGGDRQPRGAGGCGSGAGGGRRGGRPVGRPGELKVGSVGCGVGWLDVQLLWVLDESSGTAVVTGTRVKGCPWEGVGRGPPGPGLNDRQATAPCNGYASGRRGVARPGRWSLLGRSTLRNRTRDAQAPSNEARLGVWGTRLHVVPRHSAELGCPTVSRFQNRRTERGAEAGSSRKTRSVTPAHRSTEVVACVTDLDFGERPGEVEALPSAGMDWDCASARASCGAAGGSGSLPP
jgi:hypothetical protein